MRNFVIVAAALLFALPALAAADGKVVFFNNGDMEIGTGQVDCSDPKTNRIDFSIKTLKGREVGRGRVYCHDLTGKSILPYQGPAKAHLDVRTKDGAVVVSGTLDCLKARCEGELQVYGGYHDMKWHSSKKYVVTSKFAVEKAGGFPWLVVKTDNHELFDTFPNRIVWKDGFVGKKEGHYDWEFNSMVRIEFVK